MLLLSLPTFVSAWAMIWATAIDLNSILFSCSTTIIYACSYLCNYILLQKHTLFRNTWITMSQIIKCKILTDDLNRHDPWIQFSLSWIHSDYHKITIHQDYRKVFCFNWNNFQKKSSEVIQLTVVYSKLLNDKLEAWYKPKITELCRKKQIYKSISKIHSIFTEQFSLQLRVVY